MCARLNVTPFIRLLMLRGVDYVIAIRMYRSTQSRQDLRFAGHLNGLHKVSIFSSTKGMYLFAVRPYYENAILSLPTKIRNSQYPWFNFQFHKQAMEKQSMEQSSEDNKSSMQNRAARYQVLNKALQLSMEADNQHNTSSWP